MAFTSLSGVYNNIEAQYDSLVQLLEAEELKDNQIKVLWTGGYYMFETQTATLSEKISAQRNGIIVHWQRYSNGATQNYGHHYFFIPKNQALSCPGLGTCFPLVSETGYIGWKYLYINENSLVGFSVNNDGAYTQTTSKIKLYPDMWVLTQVLGV